jgi:hypothetical protein
MAEIVEAEDPEPANQVQDTAEHEEKPILSTEQVIAGTALGGEVVVADDHNTPGDDGGETNDPWEQWEREVTGTPERADDAGDDPPPPDIPDTTFGEGDDDEGEAIRVMRHECLDDVDSLLAGLDQRAREDDRIQLNTAWVELARATRGDRSQTQEYAELLIRPDPNDLAAMRFAQVSNLDVQADEILRWELLMEKTAAEEEETTAANAVAAPHIRRPLLKAVIEECERRNLPPDSWIAEVQTGEKDGQLLLLEHYARVMQVGGEYAESVREKASQTASLLLDTELFSKDEVLQLAETALQAASGTDLKDSIIAEYMDALVEMGMNVERIEDLLLLAPRLLDDPEISRETLSGIDLRVSTGMLVLAALKRAELLESIDPEAQREATWKAGLLITAGLSAQDTDTRLTRGTLNQRDLPASIDESQLFKQCAVQYANKGDGAGSMHFITKIERPRTQMEALTNAWDAVTTPEQIAHLAPTEAMRQANPDVEARFERAKARVSLDPTVVAHHVAELAEHPQRLTYGQETDLSKLLNRLNVLDPARAEALARQLLPVVQRHGSPFSHTQYLRPFYDVLRASGNLESFTAVRESIMTSTAPNAAKIHALAELVTSIRPRGLEE